MKKSSLLLFTSCIILWSCSDQSEDIFPDEENALHNEESKLEEGYPLEELAQYPFKWASESTEELHDNPDISKRKGGLIQDELKRQRGGSLSYELEASLPEGYVLTGVGLTVSGDNVSYMVLEGRTLSSDGTLGERIEFSYGSPRNLEQFIQVKDGHVVTGIELWCRRDTVKKIWLYSRKMNSNRRLTGYAVAKTGTTDSNHELQLITSQEHDLDYSRNVFTGLGVRVKKDDFKSLRGYIGLLR